MRDLIAATIQLGIRETFSFVYGGNSGGQPNGVCPAPEKPWGLCDLHGNVWEWVWDGYSTYGPGEVSNPRGRDDAPRVLRGGYWFDGPEVARSANRICNSPSPSDTGWGIGFRLVLSAPERP